MPTEWLKIDKMPRTGGPYICAWFTRDGQIGLCSVVGRRDREYWQCTSSDCLMSDKDIDESGYTHYAVLTLPNR